MDAPPDRPVASTHAHEVTTTPLRVHDLPQVAELHLQALPPSFFASLGPRFLRRYHESYLASPHGIALAAVHGQQFCGFVVGSAVPADHSAWVVRHHGLRLARAAVVAMSIRPRVLGRFVSTRSARYLRGVYRRLRPRPPRAVARAATSSHPAVLAHVAVRSAWRGRGVGELLVHAFEAEAHRRGAGTIELVTLAGPGGASRFYERLGYTATRTRQDDDGRRWQYFRLGTGASERRS